MYRFNSFSKPSLGWPLAFVIALATSAAWANGNPPFVATTLPPTVIHELPRTATIIQNCADVGHGSGSYAPSDRCCRQTNNSCGLGFVEGDTSALDFGEDLEKYPFMV
jgi:hypothetical protein